MTALCAAAMIAAAAATVSADDGSASARAQADYVARFGHFAVPPSQAARGAAPLTPAGGGFAHAPGHGSSALPSLSATPEPGTLLLMATAAAGLFGYRRRRGDQRS